MQAERVRSAARPEGQLLGRLAAMKAMSVVELKAEWQSLIGTPAPNNSRQFLEHRLAYRIQELALGGLGGPAAKLLDALADIRSAEAAFRQIDAYRRLLAGRTTGRDVWTTLRAANRVGVTRGTLEEKRDPLALL
jgi:hypothetical protein